MPCDMQYYALQVELSHEYDLKIVQQFQNYIFPGHRVIKVHYKSLSTSHETESSPPTPARDWTLRANSGFR